MGDQMEFKYLRKCGKEFIQNFILLNIYLIFIVWLWVGIGYMFKILFYFFGVVL